ncbi:hypothetical protein DSL72_002619 [Monilinia vaccinii-corymbosi]|uniref:Uncharacterized protein n=1 Tax=Monilinia vaccinii-corymbosi TaxID=61207 RepID=A0A8A3PD64_9HELO|nr:hypothetical protein DSL72_002619 [Monilinia vaccinii-corymbosi]
MRNFSITITLCACSGPKLMPLNPGIITQGKDSASHPAESMHSNNSSFTTDIHKARSTSHAQYQAEVLQSHVQHLTAILNVLKTDSPEPSPNPLRLEDILQEFHECLTWPHPSPYYRGPLPTHDHHFGATVQGYLRQLDVLVGRLRRRAAHLRLDSGYERRDMELRFHWIVQLEIERERLRWLMHEEKEGRGVVRFSERGFILG